MKEKPTDNDLPQIIKEKLRKHRTECRLLNEKEIHVGDFCRVTSSNLFMQKLKVIAEVVESSEFVHPPPVPQYGYLLTDILKIKVVDLKGNYVKKDRRQISFIINSNDVNQFSFPLINRNQEWSVLDNYEILDDGIKVPEDDWEIIVIVGDAFNEILPLNSDGGVFYSQIHRHLSIRVPKGNVKGDTKLKIQFVDMSMTHLDQFRNVYQDILQPFVEISQMIVIDYCDSHRCLLNTRETFRRPISVKFPIPQWVLHILKEKNFDLKHPLKDQLKAKLGFYFLQRMEDSWKFSDLNLVFTENHVSFDPKSCGRYVFVRCAENREIRLCQNMTVVEKLRSCIQGVTLLFAHIKCNTWYLWLEFLSIERISECRKRLESEGFIFIERKYDFPKVEENPNTNRRFGKGNSKVIDVMQRRTFELIEGMQFKFEISGAIERVENFKENDVPHENGKQFEEEVQNEKKINFDNIFTIGKTEKLKINVEIKTAEPVQPDFVYRVHGKHSNSLLIPIQTDTKSTEMLKQLVLEKLENRHDNDYSSKPQITTVPTAKTVLSDIDVALIESQTEESRNYSGKYEEEKNFYFESSLQIATLSLIDEQINTPHQTFNIFIPADRMKTFFNILTKEEIAVLEEERIRAENVRIESEKQHVVHEIVMNNNHPKHVNYDRIVNLSRPRVVNRITEREPKILSRKSLTNLSTVVRQGLTLGIHLSIPDNVVAGIGFDSLSQLTVNGMNNVTYRILIAWKRMIQFNKVPESAYVDQLINGLSSAGYPKVGELVFKRWSEKNEISFDDCQRCLLDRNFLI